MPNSQRFLKIFVRSRISETFTSLRKQVFKLYLPQNILIDLFKWRSFRIRPTILLIKICYCQAGPEIPVVIDCSKLNNVDFTAAEGFHAMMEDMGKR